MVDRSKDMMLLRLVSRSELLTGVGPSWPAVVTGHISFVKVAKCGNSLLQQWFDGMPDIQHSPSQPKADRSLSRWSDLRSESRLHFR